MSELKISDYIDVDSIDGTELILVSKDGSYRKTTIEEIRNLASDIANTELANLLNKAASAHDVKNILNAINNNFENLNSQLSDIPNQYVAKVTGKGLSTNDYDNTEKAEVAKVKDKANQIDLESEIASRTNNDANLQSQIDAISLQGTSGDSSAEVAQARVSVSGVTFSAVKGRLDNAEKSFKNYIDKKYSYDWVLKSISATDGTTWSATNRILTDTIQYTDIDLVVGLTDTSLYQFMVVLYTNSTGTFSSATGYRTTIYTIPAGSYFRIAVKYTADTTITDVYGSVFETLNIEFLNDFKSFSNKLAGVDCGSNNKIPNIDAINKTITFYSTTIIHDGKFVYAIPSDITVSIVPDGSSSTFAIYFDKKNKTIITQSTWGYVSKNYILLAYGRNTYPHSTIALFDYTINGYNLKGTKESAQFYDSWSQLEIIEGYNQTTSLAIKLGHLAGRGLVSLDNPWSVDDTTNSISSIKTIVGSTYFNDSDYMLLPTGYSFVYDLLSKTYKILDRGTVSSLYQIILAECVSGIALKGYLITQFNNSKIAKSQMLSSEGTDLATFESFSQSIQEAQNGKLTLAIQTDTHYYRKGWQRQSFNDCANLSNWFSLDAILNLGDLIRAYEDRDVPTMKLDMTYAVKDYVEKAKCPILLTKGNHDDGSLYVYNDGSKSALDTITPDLMYNRMVKPLERYGIVRNTSEENSLYYYYDIPQFKTRIIILNCIDIPYENDESSVMKYRGQWDYAYRNNQINWIANTALKGIDSNWMVIIGTHIALDSTLWTEEIYPRNNDVMYGVIKAFKNGTTYSGSGTISEFETNVSCDYTSQGSHDVIIMSGHTHAINTSYTDNIRHIIFGEYFSAIKADVMMIDRINKKAIVKTFNYDNYREYTY